MSQFNCIDANIYESGALTDVCTDVPNARKTNNTNEISSI